MASLKQLNHRLKQTLLAWFLLGRKVLTAIWRSDHPPKYWLLNELGSNQPTKKAIVCGQEQLTFAQLNEQIDNFREHLLALGLKAGERVGILLPNCVDYATCFIAPLRAGAISVPLKPGYTTQELESIFKDCQLSILITNAERVDDVLPLLSVLPNFRALIIRRTKRSASTNSTATPQQDLEGQYLNLDDLLMTATPVTSSQAVINLDDEAVYMYTSGTTGPPKGVILTHRAIVRRGFNARYIDVTPQDICYTIGDLYHNGKLFVGLIWCLRRGITFYTDVEFHPQHTIERLANLNVSLFHTSPFHFGVLAHWTEFETIPALPALRVCLSTGNRVDAEVIHQFRERFGLTIIENYGITEVGGLCTAGVPHSAVQLKVLNEAGQELGPNQVGEIVVSGPGQAIGYLNRPELSAKVFNDGWFFTGDLGQVDDKGRVQVVCRKKNLIVINGQEIYPDEIRDVLCRHPYVQDTLIKGQQGQRLKAFVVLNHPHSAPALLEFCRERLAAHKVPHIIEFCTSLPHLWQDAVTHSEFDLHS